MGGLRKGGAGRLDFIFLVHSGPTNVEGNKEINDRDNKVIKERVTKGGRQCTEK